MRYLGAAIGSLTSTDLEDVSLLHILWWVARGDGVLRVLRTTFAQVIVEGAQAVSTRLASGLDGTVILDAPVHRIRHGATVRVEDADGREVHARYAVITAPVGTIGSIEFDPELPAELAAVDELHVRPGRRRPPCCPHATGCGTGSRSAANRWPGHGAWAGVSPASPLLPTPNARPTS